MSKVKLRWENPPAGRRTGGRERIDQEVTALQRRPGKWAKLRDAAAAGNYITYRKRGVVTRVSHVGENRYDIWGCWFGSPEEPVEVTAEELEPNVKMILPKTDRVVVVQSLKPAEDDKLVVNIIDDGRMRRLNATKASTITTLGPA